MTFEHEAGVLAAIATLIICAVGTTACSGADVPAPSQAAGVGTSAEALFIVPAPCLHKCSWCSVMTGQCTQVCTDTSRDPSNCGACGHSCASGQCEHSACLPTVSTIASGLHPSSLAIDSTNVYFTDDGDQLSAPATVRSVPQNGGVPAVLATSSTRYADSVAVDTGFAYWVEARVGSRATVKRISLGGGTPEDIVSAGFTDIRQRNALVVQDGILRTNVYWASYDGEAIYEATKLIGILGRGSRGWTNRKLLDLSLPGAVRYAFAMCGDGTSLYASTYDRNIIVLGPTSPPTLSVLVNPSATASPISSSPIATDGTYVYYATAAGIAQVPVSGGTATTLIVTQETPAAIAVDGTAIYWSSPTSGKVSKEAFDTGLVVDLAIGENAPGPLAVGSLVFYATADSIKSVMK